MFSASFFSAKTIQSQIPRYDTLEQEFYLNVLGFDDDSSLRPDNKLPFDGAFVRAGNTQVRTRCNHVTGFSVSKLPLVQPTKSSILYS